MPQISYAVPMTAEGSQIDSAIVRSTTTLDKEAVVIEINARADGSYDEALVALDRIINQIVKGRF